MPLKFRFTSFSKNKAICHILANFAIQTDNYANISISFSLSSFLVNIAITTSGFILDFRLCLHFCAPFLSPRRCEG